MTWVVEAHELTRDFGSFRAVDRVSFRIAGGELFGFLGPNGAGKSTTIQMLCGVLPPSSGRGTVLGLDVTRAARAIKQQIGYMSQRFGLYQDLTVAENLEFAGRLYGLPGSRLRTRIAELLAEFDLGALRGHLAGQLSTGIRQRLSLACALIHQPQVLFLDEPTSGVDPVVREQFWARLYALAEHGITMMITTHIMDEAEHCHRLGFLHRGRLIACGTPDEVRALVPAGGTGEPPTLEEVFAALAVAVPPGGQEEGERGPHRHPGEEGVHPDRP